MKLISATLTRISRPHERQLDLETIILEPPDGPPVKDTIRTQPFGSKRAPANWARNAAFPRWAFANLFIIALFVYLDDCFTAGPVSTVDFAFRTVLELFCLFGLHAEEENGGIPRSRLN